MIRMHRGTTRLLATSLTALALLAGCVYSKETTTERQVPVAVVAAPSQQVVTYSEGRYVLYGDGKRVPYYWVWMPTGAPGTLPPAPPPVPVR